ncbi:MAG: efflux RND transporter periplasmic adaptor subunit [Oscillospiraceae bacterium]|nr:efflux RND transporter periplasmic adaptor subunit [Oscillospiraceae bacterium]MBQ3049942.1 efflux RND transporter periplasmic adaptor subunit [Oscillospiraceae bacterium]
MRAGARVLCAAITVMAVMMIPLPQKITVKNIKTAEYITVKKELHQLTAECEGELKCAAKSELYLTEPVYVEEIFVSVGDEIAEGELLLTADRETTKAVMDSADAVIGSASVHSVEDVAELEKYAEYLEKYGITNLQNEDADAEKAVRNTQSVPKKIRSPFAGTVTVLNAGKNQMCGGSLPLAVIEDRTSIYASLCADEQYANRLAVGAKVELMGSAFGDNVISAEISRIIPEVQKRISGSGVQNVIFFEAKPESGTAALLSGSSVSGRVCIGDAFECISLPYECIRQDDMGEYVWVVEENRAVKRRVETVSEMRDAAQLRGDISEGESVIYAPDGIEEGALLKISEHREQG